MKKAQNDWRVKDTTQTQKHFPVAHEFYPSRQSVNCFLVCYGDFSFSLTLLEINPIIGLQYSKETKRPKWRCALQSTLNCLLPDPTRPREVGKTAVEGLTWDLTQNDSIALKGSCLVKLRLDKLNTVLLRPKDRCRNLQILLDAD